MCVELQELRGCAAHMELSTWSNSTHLWHAHELVAGLNLLVHEGPRGRQEHHLALRAGLKGSAAVLLLSGAARWCKPHKNGMLPAAELWYLWLPSQALSQADTSASEACNAEADGTYIQLQTSVHGVQQAAGMDCSLS